MFWHSLRRRATPMILMTSATLIAESAPAQQAATKTKVCVAPAATARPGEATLRPVYATLEPRNKKSGPINTYLATLLQEIALAFAAPDSALPLLNYSFDLRLHKDGRLTEARPIESHIPSAMAEATIRAIDSTSSRGGIGPVFVDMDNDPLPVRMTFRLGVRTSDMSVLFYRLAYPAFFEFEIDKPALSIPGNPAPRYPEALREEGIEGEVLVQFVVDTLGQADMRTFRLLGPSRVYREFVQSVFQNIPKMKFSPAEYRGCKVRQLVQLPFAFKLNW
jgi:TonB family protein